MRKFAFFALLTVFSLAHLAPAHAAAGKKAPEFDVSEWLNSPGLKLADLRGKVVVIDFFQLWCPG